MDREEEPPGDVSLPEHVPEQQPGIFVTSVDTPEGKRVSYTILGGADPLTAPILLELAAKYARAQLGLG